MLGAGIVKNIFTAYGTCEKLNILCTFSYDNSNYFIVYDEDDDLICCEIKWNLWKGAFQGSTPVSDHVVRIANMLLRKSESNADLYPFKAEHYVVIKKQNKYKIINRGGLWLFEPYAKLIPFLFRLAVAILFALIYAFFCVHTSRITVAANVFGGLSRERLILLIYLIQAVGALILFLIRGFEWKVLELCLNAVVPYSAVTLIALFKSSIQVKITVVLIVFVSFLICILPKVIQAIKTRKKSLKNKRLKSALFRCYSTFVICILVGYVATRFLGVSIYAYSSTESVNENEIITGKYFDAIDGLENTKWCEYSNQEKLDLLQTICDYECTCNLGCKSPKVVAGYPERDTICGDYNHITNMITINISHMENDAEDEVLDTLLHEVRHAYQHAVVRAFNKVEEALDSEDLTLSYFQYALSYRENFENYMSGNDDYYDYYYQEVERDSRIWAEFKVSYDYYNYIYPECDESTPS